MVVAGGVARRAREDGGIEKEGEMKDQSWSCIVCGPIAGHDYPLFYETAPHAAPPSPLPYGGGALLREPSRPPNGRFRIDIRAAREYDSLLAPRPKKRRKKILFFYTCSKCGPDYDLLYDAPRPYGGVPLCWHHSWVQKSLGSYGESAPR